VSEEAYGRLGRRLRRILVMLPYAIRHPGVSVDELSRKFSVNKRDLIDDLNLVFLCGLPGYGPGDLIDVTLDEDRVYVRMADYFSAPLRLSPAEALILYAGGAALAQLPDMKEADALKRALKKLGRALGTENNNGGGAVQVRLEIGPGAHLQQLNEALLDRKRIALEYFSASRAELSSRTVDPWALIAALGRWYLVGLDHSAKDERMFRVDRIKTVRVLDEPAPVPEDFDPQRYKGAFRGSNGNTVSFEISPSAARWFEDYYPVVDSAGMDDGWRRVELASSGDRWAATLVLRLGADVRRIEPASILEAARGLASSIAALHAGVPGR
jgi:proteasome accessory factor C